MSAVLRQVNPRDPLVIDTRELGRRPGSMRRFQRTVPAPAGFGVEVIGVTPGVDIELDLRLEAVMEGVLVSGPVRALATGECSRCLEPVTYAVEAELLELYAYPDNRHDRVGRGGRGQGQAAAGGDSAVADQGNDDDVGLLVGDFIDLEPRLRDAVVLALPLQPVCSDDCPGLCPTCGARLADEAPGHTHEQLDPRWSTLQGLLAVPGESPSTTDEER